MSEPAHDVPVSPAVEQAVELARRGAITHLTGNGERVAAIVPESVLGALRAAEDAAEADMAMEEPGESIPRDQSRRSLSSRCDYRVTCAVDDKGRLITVAAVGHRREIYRSFEL